MTGLRRRTGAITWVLLVLASKALIARGLSRTLYFVWGPEPALVERTRLSSPYIKAGCLLSVTAAVWARGHRHSEFLPRAGESPCG